MKALASVTRLSNWNWRATVELDGKGYRFGSPTAQGTKVEVVRPTRDEAIGGLIVVLTKGRWKGTVEVIDRFFVGV